MIRPHRDTRASDTIAQAEQSFDRMARAIESSRELLVRSRALSSRITEALRSTQC